MVPETVIYRGPNGTTIDAIALNQELAANNMMLRFNRDDEVIIGKVPIVYSDLSLIFKLQPDPCTAEIYRLVHGKPLVLLAEEHFTADESVEVLPACSGESSQSLRR
jgi:hypothetical protein